MELSKKYSGVYKHKLKDGDIVYYIRFKDKNRKQINQKIGNKKDGITEIYAAGKRAEYLNIIRLGEDPLKHKKKKIIIDFDSISKDYFNYMKTHGGDYNNKISQGRYKNHIKPLLGKKDVDSISIEDIQKLQEEKFKKLAPKTINHITQLISTIFNRAVENKTIANNPISGLKKLKVNNQRSKYFSKNEINILLESVKDDIQLNMFIRLSLSTGGRLATICSIKKQDIDFVNDLVRLEDFKNKSFYTGFINDSILKNILIDRVKVLKPNDYILNYTNSADVSNQISKKLKKIIDRNFNESIPKNDSINRAVIHTLRHTFASHLAINGTPIFTIQKLMNHKDINQTMRYAKLAPDSGRDMVQNLYK